MPPMTEAATSTLSNGDALSLLLGAEGFLLAAVTLAVSIAAPNQSQQKYPKVTATRIVTTSTALLVLLAVGSGAAWIGMVREAAFAGVVGFFEATALVFAIVGLPGVAVLLVFGARRK